MNFRNEVFSHTEKLWVFCLGQESLRRPLPALIDQIDWYNNQILAKSLLKEQINIEFGTKTLLSSHGQLPVDRIVVVGLGEEKNLSENQAKNLLAGLNECLEGLNEKSPWIIISPLVPSDFANEVKKYQPKHPLLAHGSIRSNKCLEWGEPSSF